MTSDVGKLATKRVAYLINVGFRTRHIVHEGLYNIRDFGENIDLFNETSWLNRSAHIHSETCTDGP
jgi:hypothetical protein